ncbi:hypothetical protein LCGC14_1502250, partial [marine sediment metagenome]
MPGLSRPTGKSVRDLHHKLELDWGPRIRLDEEFRDLVHQRNPIETLELSDDRNIDPMEFRSGRAGGIIEHAGGLLMARPAMHAEPPTLNTEDTRTAEQVERASANLFEKELIANNFWQSVGRDILIYGRAFIKSMLSASQWTAEAGYPVRESKETDKDYLTRIRKWKETEGKFPFVIQHVPALGVLPLLDSSDNVLATIEVKWATAKILADDFGSKTVQDMLSRRTLKWYDELPVIEYIDNEWVSYLLAGTEVRRRDTPETNRLYKGVKSYQPLRTWRHNLGKHPIVMIPGIRTELTDYKSHFKGFLSDAKDALVMYDFLLSRLATMINAYYLPCASASEELLLPDGSRKTYGELASEGRKFEVMTRGKCVPKPVLAYAEFAGAAPIYKITLDSGRILERSEHHRIGVLGRRNHIDYKFPSDLKIGNRLAVLTKPPKRQENRKGGRWLTSDIALAVGMLIGDGSLTDNGVKFTSSNPLITSIFEQAVVKSKNPYSIFDYERQQVVTIRKGQQQKGNNLKKRAPILWALKKLNLLNKTSRTKILPDWTRCLPEKKALALFHGLILTDGYIYGSRIGYGSTSKNLRDWVADAAWRFGCPGVIREKKMQDGSSFYVWDSFREFTPDLVKKIADVFHSKAEDIFFSKVNNETLFIPTQRRRLRKKINKYVHAERVKSIHLLSERPIVCITMVDSDTPLYCTPVLEHNSYEWKLGASSAQFAGRDRPVLRVNLGGVTVTYADENLDTLAIPQGLPDATMLLAQSDDIIQRATLEDVLFGRVQGAAPAYQVNLRINVAKSKLTPLAQNMAIGITNVLDLFLRGIIQLGEAV